MNVSQQQYHRCSYRSLRETIDVLSTGPHIGLDKLDLSRDELIEPLAQDLKLKWFGKKGVSASCIDCSFKAAFSVSGDHDNGHLGPKLVANASTHDQPIHIRQSPIEHNAVERLRGHCAECHLAAGSYHWMVGVPFKEIRIEFTGFWIIFD